MQTNKQTNKRHTLAKRLGTILYRLNCGERLDLLQLSEEFNLSLRTLQRDINERLAFLTWEERGDRFYKINQQQSGFLTEEDIHRFAFFASISNLFPKIDREFYQKKLSESVQVKGFHYEDISHKQAEFSALNNAIKQHQFISFKYIKKSTQETKFYQIAPYKLLNKNGIWYLIGTENNKQKTFCFTQISDLLVLNESFTPNKQFLNEIEESDSLYHGNQISEVIIKVDSKVSHYFLRRNLLPNQEVMHKSDDNTLLLLCKNVNEQEIIPLVQYWIPYVTIISPVELQAKMIEKIQNYIFNLK
nr:WYL domain-containing protein [uncultured Haemophilus sp.]